MNLLMSCFFGATLLLLAGVSLSSSATKIMVLLRKRTMFQVYCLFIFMSAIITFATFVVDNLILWYGIYLAIVHFLFILSYSLVFDQEYPYRNFVKILLLLPFFIQIFFVLVNWDKEPSFFAYVWFPFYLVEYCPFPVSTLIGLLGLSFFLFFNK